ncbi:MAG: hypothetical protein ACLFSY_10720 [Desulfonatronovibrionaceae bacterium]
MFEYKGIYWFMHHGVLLPLTPPHAEIELNRSEQEELLKKTGARFIRWTNHFDKDDSAFWYIIKDFFGGLEELSSNTRSKIRRGQKKFAAGPVTFNHLRTEGYQTYINAFQRFSTFEQPVNKIQFEKHVCMLEESGVYEIWGVWDKPSKRLAGFSENLILGPTCFYETIYFDPSYLKNYSSYTLFYEMNHHYLQAKGFRYVHDGSRSLSHDTNIHDFLIDKFKFRKAYCDLHIAYRFDVAMLARILFPLRRFLYTRRGPIGKRLSVLLRHEEIRRCS